MPIFDSIDRRRVVKSPMVAEALPTTFGEINSSAYDHAQLNLLSNSKDISYNRAMDSILDPMFDDTEVDANTAAQKSVNYYNKPNDVFSRPPENHTEARYLAARDELTKLGKEVPPWEAITTEGARLANESIEDFQRASVYAMTDSPRMAAFLGAAGASVQDPLILASILLTMPLGLTTSALRAAAIEGAVSGVAEIGVQTKVKAWHDQRDKEYTMEDAALAVAFGTLLPAGIVGGVSKGYKLLGGTNTHMLFGPSYDVAQIRRLNSLRDGARRAKKARRTAVLREWRDDGGAGNFIHTFETGVSDGPYAPNMTSAVYSTATGVPRETGYRADALIDANGFYLEAANPARGTVDAKLATGSELDYVSYTFARSEMDKFQQENLTEALSALQRGEIPNPPHKSVLSVELFTGAKDINHVRWARDIRDLENADILAGKKRGAFAVDPENAAFKQYVNRLMLEQLEPKLTLMAGKAALPPAPKVPKPRLTPEKVSAGQKLAAKDLDEADIRLAKLAELRKEMGAKWARDERAIGEPKPNPDHFIDVEKLTRLEKRWTLQKEKATAKMESLAESSRGQQRYDVALKHEEMLKQAQLAARDLEQLRRGSVPKHYLPLRDSVSDSIVGFAKDRKLMEGIALDTGAETVLRLNGQTFKQMKESVSSATFGRPLGESHKIVDEMDTPKVNEAAYAEFKRLESSMEFHAADGEKLTVKQAMDAHIDMDNALSAMRECAL